MSEGDRCVLFSKEGCQDSTSTWYGEFLSFDEDDDVGEVRHIDPTPVHAYALAQDNMPAQADMPVQADVPAQVDVSPRADAPTRGDYEVVAKCTTSASAHGSTRLTKKTIELATEVPSL